MKSITLIRKIVRTAFAVYFWLRPLILFSNLRFPASWHESYARILPEALLLLFITYYALLAEGGWLSVAYDLFFVYFWPLFVVWFFVKYATGKAYRKLKQTTFYKELNVAKTVASHEQNVLPAGETAAKKTTGHVAVKGILIAVRPFSQFILLWALLLLHTSNVLLTWIALAVITFGAVAIVRNLSLFLSDAGSWIAKLKGNFVTQVANQVSILKNYKNSIDTKPSRDAANVLQLYETTFRYMADNKDRLARWTIIASILVTVPLYLYLSFIFTSIYLGVARLNHISWAWNEALTTAIFIPFAFTDLPHNIWIRMIGGCQALTVTILGYTVLFRRMHSSIQQLSQIASELSAPLSEQSVKEIMLAVKALPSGSNIVIQPTTNPSGSIRKKRPRLSRK